MLENQQRDAPAHIIGQNDPASVCGYVRAGKSAVLDLTRDEWAQSSHPVCVAWPCERAQPQVARGNAAAYRTDAVAQYHWKQAGELPVLDGGPWPSPLAPLPAPCNPRLSAAPRHLSGERRPRPIPGRRITRARRYPPLSMRLPVVSSVCPRAWQSPSAQHRKSDAYPELGMHLF